MSQHRWVAEKEEKSLSPPPNALQSSSYTLIHSSNYRLYTRIECHVRTYLEFWFPPVFSSLFIFQLGLLI